MFEKVILRLKNEANSVSKMEILSYVLLLSEVSYSIFLNWCG